MKRNLANLQLSTASSRLVVAVVLPTPMMIEKPSENAPQNYVERSSFFGVDMTKTGNMDLRHNFVVVAVGHLENQ